MRRNNQTNRIIMWAVIAGDFVLLNAVAYGFWSMHPMMGSWSEEKTKVFFLTVNMAMMASEWKFHTIIHRRMVSASDVLRIVCNLVIAHTIVAFLLLKGMDFQLPVGTLLTQMGCVLLPLLVLCRFLERTAIKRMRQSGRNTRTVTLVGQDTELRRVREQLLNDPTTGYQILGYYADERQWDENIPWLGSIDDLTGNGKEKKEVVLGDDMYVCLSRKERERIKSLSQLCDSQVTRFFFVPVSVESIGLSLKREYINDIEIYTTHESPLHNPANKFIKRMFDIAFSIVALALTGLLFPVIYLIVKHQSQGPVFFGQLRTGLDGKDFKCYKFRSMHVNKDADKLQATKEDPRKFPFGNFMRKTSIDELPQFWNVLKGDMSVVGPRPHMLAHTAMYGQQIQKYMVRHFVKPGITGWAQVRGFRGETRELWQMEERVKRDIWYIEHWTIWLDLRIVWLTIKNAILHNEMAY